MLIAPQADFCVRIKIRTNQRTSIDFSSKFASLLDFLLKLKNVIKKMFECVLHSIHHIIRLFALIYECDDVGRIHSFAHPHANAILRNAATPKIANMCVQSQLPLPHLKFTIVSRNALLAIS